MTTPPDPLVTVDDILRASGLTIEEWNRATPLAQGMVHRAYLDQLLGVKCKRDLPSVVIGLRAAQARIDG